MIPFFIDPGIDGKILRRRFEPGIYFFNKLFAATGLQSIVAAFLLTDGALGFGPQLFSASTAWPVCRKNNYLVGQGDDFVLQTIV